MSTKSRLIVASRPSNHTHCDYLGNCTGYERAQKELRQRHVTPLLNKRTLRKVAKRLVKLVQLLSPTLSLGVWPAVHAPEGGWSNRGDMLPLPPGYSCARENATRQRAFLPISHQYSWIALLL